MKKQFTILSFMALVMSGAVLMQSCKKDKDDDTPPAVNEFIADNSTFASFLTWPLEATTNGVDPSLGPAHEGNDSTSVRKVYFKDGVNPANGVYPIGSVIVKHTTNAAGSLNMYTGMVKRGNGFNPTRGDWEFFILMADGKIAQDNGVDLRGAGLMGGMCGDCHSGAATKDFIFSK
jgi:hypothetical protein